VNLSVYNAAGQLVKVLDSGAKAPGYHSATWDASSVPAGVYFYRLNAGEFSQTRTMVVVR
jgi:flagellar hook assembly protein FlgD